MTKNKQLALTFKTHTLGCKVNLYESEAVNSLLLDEGWQLVKNDEEATVQIINTCTVTKMSDTKSRKLIRQIIRKNPEAIIVVMGCYSQLNPDEVLSIEGVDIVIGSKGRSKITTYVYEYLENKKQLNRVLDIKNFKDYEDLKVNRLTSHTRGFIKIQDGCENFCSYCAIPFARGPIKSRHKQEVINEINQLVDSGVKEVILAGINTGTYGQDLNDINLAQLIDVILTTIPNLVRLRLSSIELMEVTDELLDLFDKYPIRLARHLHIPLQAGSNAVLLKMMRRYQTREYEAKIIEIKKRFSNIAITTDCLAGFVGETEEDFKEAIDFIKKIGFAKMHVFPYSRRSGTKADEMLGHLTKEVIEERTKILLKLASELEINFQQKQIGQEALVLIEQQKQGFSYGHTSNYIEVKVPTLENLVNKIVKVFIKDVKDKVCVGEILEVIEHVI